MAGLIELAQNFRRLDGRQQESLTNKRKGVKLMQRPEYVHSALACLADAAVAFAMFQSGVWVGCGWILTGIM